jgi:hypothetical protein
MVRRMVAREKAEEEEKSAQMYSVFVEISSPGLDELRACPPF